MAGAHGPLREDPAIEKFNTQREQHYLRFKWTPQNVRIVLWGGLIFPVAVYTVASVTDKRWKWWGTRKSEKLSVAVPDSE
ncbi:hypothetical protein L218DRAFT_1076351 [Marasmius fiardii PR-910]|nr:hypothetical protein L218DRAFT_1076351 [Marasmius fiardii PR-910]